MIAIVKNNRTLNITEIGFTALQFIYEPKKLTASKVRDMMEAVVYWQQYFDSKSDIRWDSVAKEYIEVGLSAVETELRETLQNIAILLDKNEKGLLEHRKMLFKEHNIDYRKFHGLPGAHTAESLHKAAEMKRQYERDNPEQEGLS